jgi:hypothetical protein
LAQKLRIAPLRANKRGFWRENLDYAPKTSAIERLSMELVESHDLKAFVSLVQSELGLNGPISWWSRGIAAIL